MTHAAGTRFDLTGKVAIVTGASKGIGRAIAEGLAALGAEVVLSSRKQEAVEAVAAEITAAGQTATAVAAHMGDPDAIRNLVDRAIATYGGIDIVVNNAATNPAFGPIINMDDGLFDKIYQVNVKGPYLLAKHAQPSLAERGGGSIINVASMAGISPEPLLGIYSVSKAALISLTKVMAREWGSLAIRANALCPGLIKTKFSRMLWMTEEILERSMEKQALQRLAEPEDVVGLALFLAGDASAFCTGGVYTVDGGYTI